MPSLCSLVRDWLPLAWVQMSKATGNESLSRIHCFLQNWNPAVRAHTTVCEVVPIIGYNSLQEYCATIHVRATICIYYKFHVLIYWDVDTLQDGVYSLSLYSGTFFKTLCLIKNKIKYLHWHLRKRWKFFKRIVTNDLTWLNVKGRLKVNTFS